MVVCDSLRDEKHVRALLSAIQQPQRKLFSAVTRDNMVEKIRELGNPKTKKPKDVPPFYQVTESAKSLLDAGDELKPLLLAQLVKFLMLPLKRKDLQRRAAEHKAAEERLGSIGGSSTPGRDKTKSKAKKDVATPIPVKETKLKRRGEEETTNYINDEPGNGPQHYILLLGFLQPLLLVELESIGVHVSNIIRISSTDEPCVPDTLEEEIDEEFLRKTVELETFWKRLDTILSDAPFSSRLWDVVQLHYAVEPELAPQDRPNDETDLGTQVFTGVARLIYTCLEFRRQHQHYLSSMWMIPVPAVQSEQEIPAESSEVSSQSKNDSASEKARPEVDMRHYNNLMDSVPAQANSVPLILDCMLQQVSVTEQDNVPPETIEPEPVVDTENTRLAEYMLSAVQELSHSQGERKRLKKRLGFVDDEQKPSVTAVPLLINYQDERKKRLRNVSVCEGWDPMQAETNIQQNSPVFKLLCEAPVLTDGKLTQARMQELLGFCAGDWLSRAQVQHFFNQCVFGSMPLTCASVTPEPSVMPWDDPVRFVRQVLTEEEVNNSTDKQMDSGTSELFSRIMSAVTGSRCHSLSDWQFSEHLEASVFAQALQEASLTYCHMDRYRRCHDNALFLLCHNGISPQRASDIHWQAGLHTDVPFRTYLEHISARVSDWQKLEEAKLRAVQEEQTENEPSEPETCVAPVPTIPTIPTAQPCIREGSLKAWQLEQERQKEDEQAKKDKKSNDSKCSVRKKKNSDTPKSTPESPLLPTEPISDVPQAEGTLPFTGYSMDGRLVQLQGRSHSLFPILRAPIRVESTQFVEGSTLLQVSVQKDQHHFYTHVYHRDKGCSKTCSFFALLHGGIRLSMSYDPSTPRNDLPINAKTNLQELNISTPTGLLVHFLFEQETGVDSKPGGPMVRQRISTGLGDEVSRVITSQGCVIRHLRDGSLQVLFPDGTVSCKTSCMPAETLASQETDPVNAGMEEQTVSQPGADCVWVTTAPSGVRVATVGEQVLSVPPVTLHTTTDPSSGSVVVTREDRVISVLHTDGTQVVEHADGTRITTLYMEPRTEFGLVYWCALSGTCSPSSKQKVVMVECEGFATVTMNTEKNLAQAVFGDGTVVNVPHRGTYQILPFSKGLLHFCDNGYMTYNSMRISYESDSTKDFNWFVMRPTDNCVCETEDTEHYQFQVMADGNTLVKSYDTPEVDHEGMGHSERAARYFIAHTDGSGTELLSSQSVEEFLYKIRSDPNVALICEPLPDGSGVSCLTVLEPCHTHAGSEWQVQKQCENIVPAGLRNRPWDTFPSTESGKPGPAFGTSLGRGLFHWQNPHCRPQLCTCPEVLQVRQLLQYPPLSQELRERLDTQLVEYVQLQLRREHTAGEKGHTTHLQELILTLPEESATAVDKGSCTGPEVLPSLYDQTVCKAGEQVEQEGRRETQTRSTLWPTRIVQHRQDLQEASQLRTDLRHRYVPPYFHSSTGMLFLFTQQDEDIQAITQELPPLRATRHNPEILEFLRGVEELKRNTSTAVLSPPTPAHPAHHTRPHLTRPHQSKPTAVIRNSLPSDKSEQEPLKQRTWSMSQPDYSIYRLPKNFVLVPPAVSFGVVNQGQAYCIPVALHNLGFTTGRFFVRQPPPATGLRVSYKPGPVAAGMKTQLRVELCVTSSVLEEHHSNTHLSHYIEIQTLSQYLHLHVTAKIGTQ